MPTVSQQPCPKCNAIDWFPSGDCRTCAKRYSAARYEARKNGAPCPNCGTVAWENAYRRCRTCVDAKAKGVCPKCGGPKQPGAYCKACRAEYDRTRVPKRPRVRDPICKACRTEPALPERTLCHGCARAHDSANAKKLAEQKVPCGTCGSVDRMPSGACRPCGKAYLERKRAEILAARPICLCARCNTVAVESRRLYCGPCGVEQKRENQRINAERYRRAKGLKPRPAPRLCPKCSTRMGRRTACPSCHPPPPRVRWLDPEQRENKRQRNRERYLEIRDDPEYRERQRRRLDDPEVKKQSRLSYLRRRDNDPNFKQREYEQGRKWRQENPEKSRAGWRRRRALKLGAKGSHTAEDVLQRVEAQKHRCHWCFKRMPKGRHTVDHVIPLSRGGSDGPENIVACCASCNSSKNNKMPWEFAGRLH